MLLRLKNKPSIRNLRNHSTEIVQELCALLTAGAPARPDPRRKNFYEVNSGSRAFYIHVSPATKKVMLLAVWSADGSNEAARARDQAAALLCASHG